MTKTLFGYCGKLGSGKAYCMMKEVERLKTTGNSIYLTSYADTLKKILRESFGITKEGKVSNTYPISYTTTYIRAQIVDKIYAILKELGLPGSEFSLKSQIALNYDKYPDFPAHVQCAVNATEGEVYDWHYRRCAQLLGTELGRHVYDSIWVDETFRRIELVFESDAANYAFIDDVRFLNEYRAFQQDRTYNCKVIGVTASDECRAASRGLSLEDLKAQDNHASETGIEMIIDLLPPEDVINNER